MDLRVWVDGCKLRQIFIQQGEAFVLIDAAVEQQIRIGRMIKPLVRGGKGFVGEGRDGLRVAAGDEAVRRIREQRARQRVGKQCVGVGERALHLVQHHAGARQDAVLQLIVPALLLEYLRLFVDAGEEDRVEVDVHEVEEVLIVAARDRVAGLVRVGQRVEEGIERALHQLHKRLPDGVFVAARKHAVFQYMRHARAVFGRGAEAH